MYAVVRRGVLYVENKSFFDHNRHASSLRYHADAADAADVNVGSSSSMIICFQVTRFKRRALYKNSPSEFNDNTKNYHTEGKWFLGHLKRGLLT